MSETEDPWQETVEWYYREIEPHLRSVLDRELARAFDDALVHGEEPKAHPAFCRPRAVRTSSDSPQWRALAAKVKP